MKYACLVYFQNGAFDHFSPEQGRKLTDDSIAYDRELDAAGHLVIAEALELPSRAVTIRVRDGKMSATDGPFAETREILAGFVLIEASDMNEAMRLAAGIPLAKIGSIEIRPIMHTQMSD